MSPGFLVRWVALSLCLAAGADADTLASCRERIAEAVAGAGSAETLNPDGYPGEVFLLSRSCPELSEELATDPWAPLLARAPDQRFIADAEGLAGLGEYYSGTGPGHTINTSETLGLALASLQVEEQPSLSVWEQIWRWLREYASGSDLSLPGWFGDFSISADALEWTLYASMGAILIAALAIVGNELRHGLRMRRRVTRRGWLLQAAEGEDGLSFSDLAGANLSEQPGLLLRIVINGLQAAGRIEYRPSMTHRDIIKAAAHLDRVAELAIISTAAERCAFGGWQPARDEIAELVESGRVVLAEPGGGTP